MKNGKTGLLAGKNVLLGVTGGIGAYKAAQLLRDLQREGAQVSVVMTASATRSCPHRKLVVDIVVIVQGQPDLLHVVLTTRPPGRFPCLLHGRKQQCN